MPRSLYLRTDGVTHNMYTVFWWIIGVAAVLAVLYGLHRLALYLEKRGLVYYLNEKPQSGGGSMFSPFQEMIQPEIRHIQEVQDERRYKREDAGEPPSPRAAPTTPSGDQSVL
jgi:hypothetical protein